MSKKILQLISEDFEDLEVWYPVYRCREEGWQVDFAAEKPGLPAYAKAFIEVCKAQ